MDLVNSVTDAYLETAEGSDAARLRFLAGIWDIQSRFEAADRRYDAPDAATAREALATGRPLFRVSTPEVPVAEYMEAVSLIAQYTIETAGLPAEQISSLQGAGFAAAIDQARLVEAVRSPEAFVAGVAKDVGAKPDGPLTPATVAFVLISALVPFLTGPSRSAVETLGEAGLGLSGGRNCPVCGSGASMGIMGESTQLKGAERRLWCNICHAEWNYERLRCTRCGCRNPDKLRYTHVEGDSAHRVHLCDECHGYMRFVFIDDLRTPLSMVVEDAMTATLEAVASQQGYTATGDGGKGSC